MSSKKFAGEASASGIFAAPASGCRRRDPPAAVASLSRTHRPTTRVASAESITTSDAAAVVASAAMAVVWRYGTSINAAASAAGVSA